MANTNQVKMYSFDYVAAKTTPVTISMPANAQIKRVVPDPAVADQACIFTYLLNATRTDAENRKFIVLMNDDIDATEFKAFIDTFLDGGTFYHVYEMFV